jgi:hypothetical protein
VHTGALLLLFSTLQALCKSQGRVRSVFTGCCLIVPSTQPTMVKPRTCRITSMINR